MTQNQTEPIENAQPNQCRKCGKPADGPNPDLCARCEDHHYFDCDDKGE